MRSLQWYKRGAAYMASRIIKDALEAKMIKEENAEGNNRHNYIPYWA